MTWVLIVLGGWLVVAVLASLVIGRTVHKADVIEKTEETGETSGEGRGDDAPPAAGLVGFVPPLARRALADH